MTGEITFTPEEWETLRQAPLLAGMAVATASMSGQWGSMREEATLYDVIAKTASDSAEISLIQDIAASIKQSPPAIFNDIEAPHYRERALAACAAASNILDARLTPVAAQRYRNWVVSVGQLVAEASREGAFLGLIGGKRVSDEEAQLLSEIEVALRSQLVGTMLGKPGLESDNTPPILPEQSDTTLLGNAAMISTLLSPAITEREITEFVQPPREAHEVF